MSHEPRRSQAGIEEQIKFAQPLTFVVILASLCFYFFSGNTGGYVNMLGWLIFAGFVSWVGSVLLAVPYTFLFNWIQRTSPRKIALTIIARVGMIITTLAFMMGIGFAYFSFGFWGFLAAGLSGCILLIPINTFLIRFID